MPRMSMWLNLAKVTPELLTAIRAEPALLDRVFFDGDGGPLDGVDPVRDVFGCDYLTLGAVAAAREGKTIVGGIS